MRICTTCGLPKDDSLFSKASGTHKCAPCRVLQEKARQDRKRAEDPEAWKAKRAAFQKCRRDRKLSEDPDAYRKKANANLGKWRERQRSIDPDGFAKKQREQNEPSLKRRIEKNPNYVTELSRKWQRRNPERNRQLHRISYHRTKAADPGKVLGAKALARQKRRAKMAHHSVTPMQWTECLEFHNHACAYCLRSGLKLTLDHVIPLAKGGAHDPGNIVPACESCNKSKGARGPIDLLFCRHLIVTKRMLAAHSV